MTRNTTIRVRTRYCPAPNGGRPARGSRSRVSLRDADAQRVVTAAAGRDHHVPVRAGPPVEGQLLDGTVTGRLGHRPEAPQTEALQHQVEVGAVRPLEAGRLLA